MCVAVSGNAREILSFFFFFFLFPFCFVLIHFLFIFFFFSKVEKSILLPLFYCLVL